jgi:glutamyl-tRNA synthetase
MLPWLEAEGLSSGADVAARPEWFRELAPLVSERIKLMTEVVPLVKFLFVDDIEVDEKARTKALEKDPAATQKILEATCAALDALTIWETSTIDEALHKLPEQLDLKPRVVFQAIRAKITGTLISPPIFESIALLGRERTMIRLRS